MKNKYSISEWIKTCYSYIITKIWFKNARLIRRPVYIRGIKSIEGAKELTTGRFCRFDLDGTKKTLFIGNNCEFGDMTHIAAYNHVEIGNNVLIASKCYIADVSHGRYRGKYQSTPESIPKKRVLYTEPVIIEDNVWIGENVVILGGVKIGEGCIIGANSVVTKSIKSKTIAAGSPAVPIKIWNEIERKWVLI